MRKKSTFTIYTRDMKDGKQVFYASFYDRNGSRLQRATGVEDNGSKMARGRAEDVVIGWIAEEKARKIEGKPEPVLLKDFASDFYKWGECQWLKRQLAKGRQIGKAWAAQRRRHVDKYILEAFGPKTLEEITRPMVERWIIGIPLSGSTRNQILYSFRIIMGEAEAEGLISRNPLEKIEPMGIHAKARNILSLGELQLLFPADDEECLRIWKPERRGMPARECFTLMLTMAYTGIRVGEARALQWRHILPKGYLYVERAIKADGSIGSTKGREVRVAILTDRTQAELSRWRGESLFPENEDLVFYGSAGDKPINKRTFGDVFSRGLKNAGISTAGRILVTHSLRHTYNTLMRRAVTLETLQMMMGHKSDALTDRYTHEGPELLIAALEPERDKVEKAFKLIEQ